MSNTSEPLRILHVIPTLAKGGAERLCLDIVRQLKTRPDVEVRLVTFRDVNLYAGEYPDIRPEVLDVHVTPSITGRWDVKLDDWERFIEGFRPHVIHSHLYEAEMVVHHRLLEGLRYVMHCHQSTRQLQRFHWGDLLSKQRMAELYERHFLTGRFVACGNVFLAISEATRDHFMASLPEGLHQNILLFPNAIDFSKFSAGTPVAPTEGQTLRLVNVGRFHPKKNQQFLLSVVKLLIDRKVPVHLTLLGDGPLLQSCERRAVELGIAGHVDFAGNVTNVEEHLWQGHVYVHSALQEPFGLVLLEAMAAGLPVVTLDGGGNRDLIEEGKNGYLLIESDTEAFADRIVAICSDASRYREMADHACEFSKQYDIVPYCERLMDIYRQTLTS